MEDRRPVSQDQFEGRNRLCDERFARDKERIENQEERTEQLQKLTIEMASLNKKHDEKLGEHEQRITCLERQPADQYGKLKLVLATAIISGVVGAIITAAVSAMNP